jgi:hypothetical protein
MNGKKAKKLRKLSRYLNISPSPEMTYKAAKEKYKTLDKNKRAKI